MSVWTRARLAPTIGGLNVDTGRPQDCGNTKKRIPVKRVMEDGKISNVAGSGR